MATRKGKFSHPEESGGLGAFSEYVCRNGACVLSRFDRFSMASAGDARCPVCGEVAWPAADETPPN